MAHLDASGITRLVTDLKDRFATLVSGAVPIAQGGTGATTATGAATNIVDEQDIAPASVAATSGIGTTAGNVYTHGGDIYTSNGSVYTNDGGIYTSNGSIYARNGDVFTRGGDVIIKNAAGTTDLHKLSDKQDQHKTATCSLTVAGWSGNAQTASAAGVTATNTVIVAPAPASATAWAAAGVICTAQAAGSLTFTCTTAPTEALTANVLILG